MLNLVAHKITIKVDTETLRGDEPLNYIHLLLKYFCTVQASVCTRSVFNFPFSKYN